MAVRRLGTPFDVVPLVLWSSVSDKVSRCELQHPGQTETLDTGRCFPLNVATLCIRLLRAMTSYPSCS